MNHYDQLTSRSLSSKELRLLGLGEVCYLRDIKLDGGKGVALFAADGARLAIVPSQRDAWMLARQQDLELIVVQ